jgi:hypothetical protein
MRSLYISKKVNQRRNIYGSFKIDDYLSTNEVKYIFKWPFKGGLLKGISSVGSLPGEFAESFGKHLSSLQKIL